MAEENPASSSAEDAGSGAISIAQRGNLKSLETTLRKQQSVLFYELCLQQVADLRRRNKFCPHHHWRRVMASARQSRHHERKYRARELRE